MAELQAAQEWELQAARREEPAADRKRAALGRAALVALGAEGEDLVDAERLLATDDKDADTAQIQAPAEALVPGVRSCSVRSVRRRCRRPGRGPGRAHLVADAAAEAGRGRAGDCPLPRPGARVHRHSLT
ncbi:hypothetical protein [Streptomyces sp. NPDC001604]|uniref:hypothetical protein n=1 Tax=Streptomyces sp. NPDC001604 TaxID=3364593 RepID=UPI0036AAE82D